MCCHDVDLVGPSLLQCLRCCHKTVDVIDDVILRDKWTDTDPPVEEAGQPDLLFMLL